MSETDVERLFRHIVHTLRADDPSRLRGPILLHDLLTRIVPYRNARRALGVDTSEDYELLVLRLAGGEGGFATTDPEPVHVRFAEEAVSVNPELGVLQEFRDARVHLDLNALDWVLAGHTHDEAYAAPATMETPPPPPQAPAEPVPPPPRPPITPSPPVPATPPPAPAPTPAPPPRAEAEHSAPPAPRAPAEPQCLACGGWLPATREVHFCPHCGRAQARGECPHCLAEVAYGWNFCVACGGGLAWES